MIFKLYINQKKLDLELTLSDRVYREPKISKLIRQGGDFYDNCRSESKI